MQGVLRYRISEEALLGTALGGWLLEGHRIGVQHIRNLGDYIVRAQRLRTGLKNAHQRASKGSVILVVIRILSFHGRFIRGSRSNDDGVAPLRNLLQVELRYGRRIVLLLLRHIAVVVGQGAQYAFGHSAGHGAAIATVIDGGQMGVLVINDLVKLERQLLVADVFGALPRIDGNDGLIETAFRRKRIPPPRSMPGVIKDIKIAGMGIGNELIDRGKNSLARSLLLGQDTNVLETELIFQQDLHGGDVDRGSVQANPRCARRKPAIHSMSRGGNRQSSTRGRRVIVNADQQGAPHLSMQRERGDRAQPQA